MLYLNKKDLPCWPRQSKTVSKIVGFSPQLIRNVQSRRRIDSSIIAHPVNLRLERSLNCYAKNSTYTVFYISSTWDWLHHISQFLFMKCLKKKKVFKIFKSWQVCDWLAKWIIMLGFMDLRWPRVFRRFSVGLVNSKHLQLENIIVLKFVDIFSYFFNMLWDINLKLRMYVFGMWHDTLSMSFLAIRSFWPSLLPQVDQIHFFHSWPEKSRYFLQICYICTSF